MTAKYTANWGVQIVRMIFQTRSNKVKILVFTGECNL